MILLPGMHGTPALFKPFTDISQTQFDFRAYHYPQEGGQEYEHLAIEVEKFIIKTPGKQWLLGESFSGPMALMMALKMPQKFFGVILSGTFSHNPSPILHWVPNAWVAEMILKTGKPFASYFSLGFNADKSLERLFSETIEDVPYSVLAARLMAVKNINLDEQLNTIKLPVLSILAKHDHMVGDVGGQSLHHLAHYEEVTIDSHHLILQQQPEEALRVILQFIKNIKN